MKVTGEERGSGELSHYRQRDGVIEILICGLETIFLTQGIVFPSEYCVAFSYSFVNYNYNIPH